MVSTFAKTYMSMPRYKSERFTKINMSKFEDAIEITPETLDPATKLRILTYVNCRKNIEYLKANYGMFLNREWVKEYPMMVIHVKNCNSESVDYYSQIVLLNAHNNARLLITFRDEKYVCAFKVGNVLIDTVEYGAVYANLQAIVENLRVRITAMEDLIFSTINH
jgi:hypothetical protein